MTVHDNICFFLYRYLYFTQTGRLYRWNYISESPDDKLYSNSGLNDIDAIAIEVPGQLKASFNNVKSKVHGPMGY